VELIRSVARGVCRVANPSARRRRRRRQKAGGDGAAARHDHHLDDDDDGIPFDLHAPVPFLAEGDRDAELATKWRREVAAWRREVTEWRRDASSTANTPLPASTSSAAFSPVSSRVLSSPFPMG
jgi:hypothetical protein